LRREAVIDDSEFYHWFARAIYRSNEPEPTMPAWLAVDSFFLFKYAYRRDLPASADAVAEAAHTKHAVSVVRCRRRY
jgi:hypothetical protein